RLQRDGWWCALLRCRARRLWLLVDVRCSTVEVEVHLAALRVVHDDRARRCVAPGRRRCGARGCRGWAEVVEARVRGDSQVRPGRFLVLGLFERLQLLLQRRVLIAQLRRLVIRLAGLQLLRVGAPLGGFVGAPRFGGEVVLDRVAQALDLAPLLAQAFDGRRIVVAALPAIGLLGGQLTLQVLDLPTGRLPQPLELLLLGISAVALLPRRSDQRFLLLGELCGLRGAVVRGLLRLLELLGQRTRLLGQGLLVGARLGFGDL